jgi:hypothetical protein
VASAAEEAPPRRAVTRPSVTRLAWALCALSVGLAMASVALAAVNGESPAELVTDHHAIGILNALVVAPIGALIVVGDRRHLLAWLFLVEALSLSVFNFTQQYAPLALGLTPRRLSLPGGELASWLTSWTNLPGVVIGVVFLVLLFPDGRMPSRRWWPLGVAGAAAATVPTLVLAVGTWPLRGPALITPAGEEPSAAGPRPRWSPAGVTPRARAPPTPLSASPLAGRPSRWQPPWAGREEAGWRETGTGPGRPRGTRSIWRRR